MPIVFLLFYVWKVDFLPHFNTNSQFHLIIKICLFTLVILYLSLLAGVHSDMFFGKVIFFVQAGQMSFDIFWVIMYFYLNKSAGNNWSITRVNLCKLFLYTPLALLGKELPNFYWKGGSVVNIGFYPAVWRLRFGSKATFDSITELSRNYHHCREEYCFSPAGPSGKCDVLTSCVLYMIVTYICTGITCM